MTAVCIIPNCGRRCPGHEPFCSEHRDKSAPGDELSPRQRTAKRFADRLGTEVDRRSHHPHNRKRYYEIWVPGIHITVEAVDYIKVNLVLYRSEVEAFAAVEKLAGKIP